VSGGRNWLRGVRLLKGVLAAAPTAVLALGLAMVPVAGCSGGGSTGGSGDSSKPQSDGAKQKKSQEGDKQSGAGKQAGAATTIHVDTEQQRNAGIRVEQIRATEVPRTLEAPAQVMMDENRTVHVSSLVEGMVTAVLAKPGDVVARGTTLARVHSHMVHETIGALEQSMADARRRQAAVTFQQQRVDRYTHLYAIQAASLEESQRSQQDLLQARNDLANSEVMVQTERQHLADLLQVEPSSLNEGNLNARDEVPIRASISGTVMTRTVTPGQVLEPGTEAYTISDLGSVWIIANIAEENLSRVRRGDVVHVRTDAWPGESFEGRVTLIGSMLDPATRTVQVRATLANPQGRLKPLMFTTAQIAGFGTRQAVFVPEDALQDVNGVAVVFVTQDGTHFTPQTVKTAPPVNHQVEVLEGLRPGEQAAVAGTFMLKSELLKGTIGED
jgi:RND family efflux transporter MFP subunit